MQTKNSHPIIDLPDFIRDFSRHDEPELPTELSFWKTLDEEEKNKILGTATRQGTNPMIWKEGQGKNYLEAVSKSRSINLKNKYWLKIFEKEMRDAGDQKRLGRVLECLSTYYNIDNN